MMSSEEDLDPRCCEEEARGPAAKQQSSAGSKAKRVRQRVDAGEPRNSYASIPNFSSRAAAFACGRMLCDLMMTRPKEDLESSGFLAGNGFGSPERCSSTESASSHLLRDILQQGRAASGGHAPKGAGERGDGEGRRMSAAADSPGRRSPSSPRGSESDTCGGDASPAATQAANPASGSAESKRARVETIVSNMLQGPNSAARPGGGAGPGEPQPPVNGCKKRKLYQPQQHDKSLAAVNGNGFGVDDEEDDVDEEDEDYLSDGGGSPLAKRLRNGNSSELSSFKQQIRQVQQQLVALQQQYMEMAMGDSTDEDCSRNNDRPADLSDCEDAKPRKTDSSRTLNSGRFLDYDNASLYEEQRGRLVIDDGKDSAPPSKTGVNGSGQRQSCIVQPPPAGNNGLDIEWLAESLKAELSTSLSQVVDAVVSRCIQRKKAAAATLPPDSSDTPTAASTPKDPTLLSQMLDRKSPRTCGGLGGGKVVDRGSAASRGMVNGGGGGLRTSPYPPDIVGTTPRPPFFFPLKQPANLSATAAFLYGSPPSQHQQAYSSSARSTPTPQDAPEQTEAMSLVVTPKKKRHKVTDTRLQQQQQQQQQQQSSLLGPKGYAGSLLDPLGAPVYHHPPPPLVPVSLPTSVAIPNPSLNQSELFHSFQQYSERLSHHFSQQPQQDDEGGPPLQLGPLHHPMLPPFHRGSPDSGGLHHLPPHLKHEQPDNSADAGDSPAYDSSGLALTSTLTPMHLRKAKLMFFYARYPSSAVLKMYFPDIKFNKNNTAQLVKWFSNFREFFYIQMEKYARQAMSEGIKSSEDLKVNADSELLRVLNLHYNRNNHIEAPENFRYVVEQTLREFFKALMAGKDAEQSWKKSIYKIIARLDDNVPEYFKNPNFLESLE